MKLSVFSLLILMAFGGHAVPQPRPTGGAATIGSLAISLGEMSHYLPKGDITRNKRHELVGEGSKISLKLNNLNENGEQTQEQQDQTVITLDFAAQKEALLNNIFETIEKLNYMGCFRRLVCDVASSAAANANGNGAAQQTGSIVDSVEAAQQLELSDTASRVAEDLMEAIRYGEKSKEESGKCETKYDQCQFTSDRMQEVTLAMKTKMFGLLKENAAQSGDGRNGNGNANAHVNVDAENAPAKATSTNSL